jgi:hypothetical protein
MKLFHILLSPVKRESKNMLVLDIDEQNTTYVFASKEKPRICGQGIVALKYFS